MRAQAPGQSVLLLLDAVVVLTSEKIDYAVIGAIAASVHAVVRASVDADAVLSVTRQQLEKLEGKFVAAGFQTELASGDEQDPIPAMLKLRDGFENRVDLLAGLRGMEVAAFSRAIDVPFMGETLRVIGREDFIAMKVFAGGPQDLSDAGRAIAMAAAALDTPLLRRLAQRYGHAAVEALEMIMNERRL
jgi:hypothetical protein